MKRKMSVATLAALRAFVLAALAGVLLLSSSDNSAAQSSVTTLVSNLGQGDTSTELFVTQSGNHRRAIRFTVGSIAGNYTLDSVVIDLETVPTDTANFHVRIMYGGDGTDPGGVKSNLTAPATLVVGNNTYTAPANTGLTTGANYFVMYEYAGTGSDSVRIAATITGDVDSGAAEGWDIHNVSRRWQASSFRWVTSNPEPKFQIRGSANTSNDATLSALSLSGVTLSRTFASGTTSYTANVANSVSSTTVTATTNHASANAVITPADADSVTPGHQVNLGVGDTDVTVEVTAEDTTTTETYTVTVTRPSNDATLSALSLSGVTLSRTFASGTTSYTANVANSVSSTTITATPNHAGTGVRITGGGSSADDEPLTINLGVGDTVITVWVTAEDTTTTKTYTVTVTRAAAALNNPPVFPSGTITRSVAENTGSGQNVGAPVAATDDDSGDTLAYRLEGTDGGSFAIVSTSGQIQTSAALDYEAKSSYSVTVKVNDGTVDATKAVTIGVTDVVEPPGAPATPTVSAKSGTTDSLDVRWSAPANTGPDIDDYDVQYRIGTSGSFTSHSFTGTGRSTTIAGLTADTTYEVQVQAHNDEGHGAWSASGTARTNAATSTVSSDATLSALSLSGAVLSSTFASGTTTYTADVANSVSSTTVTATPNHASANAVITPSDASGASGHQVNLGLGDTVITVVVTAEDNTTKTYTVTVTRAAAQTRQSNDATLRALSLSGAVLSSTFASGTTTYTADVANSVSSTTVTATPNHASANAVITPSDASGASGHQVNLGLGDTVITVVVTAEDNTTKTYTVTVTRAAAQTRQSNDATLRALSLSGAVLSSTFASGTTMYTADVANSVSSTTVTATPNHASANAVITPSDASGASGHQVNLGLGDTVITVVVTAEDNTTKTYTVTVTRADATRGPAPRPATSKSAARSPSPRPDPDPSPRLEGVFTAPAEAAVGGAISYTLTVTNTGAMPLTGVTWRTAPELEVERQPVGDGKLAPGESATLTASFALAAHHLPGPIIITVYVDSDQTKEVLAGTVAVPLTGTLQPGGSVPPGPAPSTLTLRVDRVRHDAPDTHLAHNIPDLTLTLAGGTEIACNFLTHYDATGGLTRWGWAISEVLEERAGALTQYYQRGVVDCHERDGVWRMERRLAWDYLGGGLEGAPDLGVEPGLLSEQPGELVGPWGHRVSNYAVDGTYTGFLDFFTALGGVASFGYPKTEARYDDDPGAALGIPGANPGFIRQYFQAAVMEYHPGDPLPVKLGLLGNDLRDRRYPNQSYAALASFGSVPPLTEGQVYVAEAAPTPTPTASAEPAVETGLAADCLLGGVLDNVATIFSCAEQAMQQVKSFSFEGEFNLLALFPSEDAGTASLMTISGAIVLPDRIRFEISFSAEGEMIQTAGVVIGGDTYMRDPESDMWFKGNPPDADFLEVVPLVGLLLSPKHSNATLNESISLDDGTEGYVLTYDQTGQQSGTEGPGSKVVVVLGADDFLTREVSVALVDVNDEAPNLVTIRYHGYNEPKEIEPPAQYVTIPENSMDSEAPGAPTVVGFARNEDGDVEVRFSEPVSVQGQVELYVLDSATGGWVLPLIGGSGTAILTFDADAEDRPPLVVGESQIAGFIFPTPDSHMTDTEGARLDLTFDQWTYR